MLLHTVFRRMFTRTRKFENSNVVQQFEFCVRGAIQASGQNHAARVLWYCNKGSLYELFTAAVGRFAWESHVCTENQYSDPSRERSPVSARPGIQPRLWHSCKPLCTLLFAAAGALFPAFRNTVSAVIIHFLG